MSVLALVQIIQQVGVASHYDSHRFYQPYPHRCRLPYFPCSFKQKNMPLQPIVAYNLQKIK